MIIKTIGTGSNGNCYIVQSGDKYIVLDCGLPFEQITHDKAFPKFRDISFVFVSHSHHDHDKALKDFKRSGCEIISYETLKREVEQKFIDNFALTTFVLPHNVDNWGIIIHDRTTDEQLCYVTDFYALPRIEGVEQWLYEVNYVEKNINAQIDKGRDFKHTNFTFHNSLENAKSYFEKLETRPKEITICHLSKDNGDYKYILREMSQFADIVKLADKEKE